MQDHRGRGDSDGDVAAGGAGAGTLVTARLKAPLVAVATDGETRRRQAQQDLCTRLPSSSDLVAIASVRGVGAGMPISCCGVVGRYQSLTKTLMLSPSPLSLPSLVPCRLCPGARIFSSTSTTSSSCSTGSTGSRTSVGRCAATTASRLATSSSPGRRWRRRGKCQRSVQALMDPKDRMTR